ncbi:MAG: ATP-dependent nuclease [Candidatus Zhuqueibacterota bacterium]
MIKNVKIENFKIFKSIETDIKNFTVLMGENGCGKTTILQAIALGLRIFSSTDLIKYDKTRKTVRFRPKGVPYPQLPGFNLEDITEIFYSKQARGGSGGGVTPIKIELTDNDGNVYKLNITSLFGAYTTKCESKKNDFVAYPSLIDCNPLFISGFVGITTAEERLFPRVIQDRMIRGQASSILRNLLLDLKENEPNKFERMKDKIEKFFNFNLGMIDFNQDRDIFVHAKFTEKIGPRKIALDLSSSGSGFLQALQILTSIYLFSDKSKVVLLDEPDAHLHPNLQRITAQLLQEISNEENLQIIISTHSTPIIREVDPSSILPVSSKKSSLAYLKSDEEMESEILLRLDNFEKAKASIAGKIFFVEDRNIKILRKLDTLLETYLIDGINAVPLIRANGKDDKIPFRIKGPLEAITGTNIDVYFLRDSDGISDEWKKKITDYAKDNDVNLFLLNCHEMESYLINPKVISGVLSELSVNLSEEEVKSILVKIMKDVIAMSRYGFDNTLANVINNTARLLNEHDFKMQDAQREAADIRGKYENMNEFEALARVAPAKETLKEFFKKINEEYKIQITSSQLLSRLSADDIDNDLKEFLRQIKA